MKQMPDFQALRVEYASQSLDEYEVQPDPVQQFAAWFEQAVAAGLREPNAMALATATPDGVPSVRIVLLKECDARGFVFFTNYDSAKGRELARNPRAALCFYWNELERQVRITGEVERVPVEESDAYFGVRPLKSRYGAAISPQSRAIPNRQWLEERMAEWESRHGEDGPPRPEHWGGYRLKPQSFEFWQGRRSRLHDRVLYLPDGPGNWKRSRLAP